MRVLGIDPGYTIVGWGVGSYAGKPLCTGGFWRGVYRRRRAVRRRLDEVYAGVKRSSARRSGGTGHQLFYQHNQTTVGVARARGVILLAAARAGLPI